MFQDIERDQRFVVVTNLDIRQFRLGNQAYDVGTRCAYESWCTVIELVPGAPGAPSLFESIVESLRQIDVLYLENKDYVATSAIQDGVVVKATLALEEFLERKEFILTVEVCSTKDKDVWQALREKRMELFLDEDKSEGTRVQFGYRTELGG